MDTLTTNQAIAAGGIIGGMLATLGIVAVVFSVMLIIAEWKILTKAGEPGWKSLIPIYNVYMFYKIAGVKNWFWYTIIISVVCSLVTSFGGGLNFNNDGQIVGNPSALAIFGYAAQAIATLIIGIYANYKLAKAFGKGAGFTVGLVLLPSIFTLILGFGSAKYDKKAIKA